MDPHYWPSLYPGIVLGLLVGFASGGWLALLLGGAGGLGGAVAGLALNGVLGLQDGFFAMVVPAVCAALAAKALIMAAALLTRAPKT